METRNFDLIVIGTGASSSTAAGKCAAAGWKVAQIDELPFGGTCALRGCDPKKVLVGAADLMDWNRRMQGSGVQSNASIDWQELMQFKRGFIDSVPEYREQGMKDAGITPFHGHARFIDEETIRINDQEITGKKFLIAAGAKPAQLPIEGFEHLKTSTDFLELDTLPEKIVFVGGGYISFEFAFVAALAGTKVHIIHRGEHPLKGFDPDLVDLLMQKAEELGIEIHLNAEVKKISQNGNGYEVQSSRNDEQISITGDLVVHGAGRVPNIDGLDLANGGVERSKPGIVVNEYLQSRSNPRVYSAGDAAATDGKPLTPVAGYESRIVTNNILEGNHNKANYPSQPTVVFTIPPLASVGLSEAEAKSEGIEVDVHQGQMDSWYTYRRINESYAAYKTIFNKENGKLLGAHLLGTKSEEIINLYAMAINQGLTASDLKEMIYSYPTHSSDIKYMVS